MWQKEKKYNPIVRLALLLALATTPMAAMVMPNLTVAQTTENGSFPLPQTVPNGTKLRIDGSNSMATINQTLKQRFEQQFSGTSVEAAASGAENALKALQDGNVDLVGIGRGLTAEEKAKGLEQVRLRREKIAIVVGADNPFKGSLTSRQFAQIFRGEITDWSQVGGQPGKIRLIDRPETSDTRESFRNYPVFRSANFATGATASQLSEDNTVEMAKQLGKDGISYVIANQVSKLPGVRILELHKTLPDDARYPFSQPLVYVYKKNPNPAVASFLGYSTASPGEKAVEEARATEASAIAEGKVLPLATAAALTATQQAANATATPSAEATTNPTATPNAEATTNATATPNAEATNPNAATNAAANTTTDSGNQAYVAPDSNATTTAETRGVIPWWWLLPLAALGGLGLWWVLGKRNSQEEIVEPAKVPVGVGAATSDASVTPLAASTGTTDVTAIPPVVVVDDTNETTSTNLVTPVTTSDISGTPVVTIVDNTSANVADENTNTGTAIAGGIAAAGAGAALWSRFGGGSDPATNETTEINNVTPTPVVDETGLDLEAPVNVTPTPVVDETGLDLEAPVTVVNTNYPQIPNVPTTSDVDTELPVDEPQENSNWLGNIAAAGAATVGGAALWSRFGRGSDAATGETTETEITPVPQVESDVQLEAPVVTSEVVEAPQPEESSSWLGNIPTDDVAVGSRFDTDVEPIDVPETETEIIPVSETDVPQVESDVLEAPELTTEVVETQPEQGSNWLGNIAASGAAAVGGAALWSRFGRGSDAEATEETTEVETEVTAIPQVESDVQLEAPVVTTSDVVAQQSEESSSWLGNVPTDDAVTSRFDTDVEPIDLPETETEIIPVSETDVPQVESDVLEAPELTTEVVETQPEKGSNWLGNIAASGAAVVGGAALWSRFGRGSDPATEETAEVETEVTSVPELQSDAPELQLTEVTSDVVEVPETEEGSSWLENIAASGAALGSGSDNDVETMNQTTDVYLPEVEATEVTPLPEVTVVPQVESDVERELEELESELQLAAPEVTDVPQVESDVQVNLPEVASDVDLETPTPEQAEIHSYLLDDTNSDNVIVGRATVEEPLPESRVDTELADTGSKSTESSLSESTEGSLEVSNEAALDSVADAAEPVYITEVAPEPVETTESIPDPWLPVAGAAAVGAIGTAVVGWSDIYGIKEDTSGVKPVDSTVDTTNESSLQPVDSTVDTTNESGLQPVDSTVDTTNESGLQPVDSTVEPRPTQVESNIVLTPRTPKWAYVTWQVSDEEKEILKEQGGSQLALRLYDVTDIDLSYQTAEALQTYECEEAAHDRFIAIPVSDRNYVVEIGYLTSDNSWLLLKRSAITRVSSRSPQEFWFDADVELIIHGATQAGARVSIGGRSIKAKPDGTFHLRIPFCEELIDFVMVAVSADGEQAKTIHRTFTQDVPEGEFGNPPVQ